MKAPTLTDVARHAGVSYATADRVINARGKVARKSALKVEQAIAALGYVRNVAAANLSQGRVYRFGFVVPTGENAFFQRLRSVLAEAAARLTSERVEVRVIDVAPFDPSALSALLGALASHSFDGVAVVASEGMDVVPAMQALRADGVAVLTLVSDVEPAAREQYVGIDNVTAGRTAARMVGLAHAGQPGKALVIVGALEARDHRDRLAGFRETLAGHFPSIAVLPEVAALDRHDLVEAQARAALAADPEITAIYSLGAGNSGLLRALGALPPVQKRPVTVVHDLVPPTRQGLEAGMFDVVIDQRPEEEIARALSLMRRLADRLPPEPGAPILPTIYVNENLPPDNPGQ